MPTHGAESVPHHATAPRVPPPKDTPPPADAAPPKDTPPPADAAPPKDTPPPSDPAPPKTEAPAPSQPEASSPPAAGGPGGRKGARPKDEDALARLVQAEEALARGDADGALRHARASIGKEPSATARAVLVKAACEKRDLGLAKAMARELRGPELREARAHCTKLGISL